MNLPTLRDGIARGAMPDIECSDEFLDLVSIPDQDFSPAVKNIVIKRAMKRMACTPFNEIELPQMQTEIPEDHSNYRALSDMKLSLMKNSYLRMNEKDEIMQGIIAEIDGAAAEPEAVGLGFNDD